MDDKQIPNSSNAERAKRMKRFQISGGEEMIQA